MSDAGDILTALTTDVEAAISGVTVGTDPITSDDLTAGQLPYCVLLQIEYGAEPLEWGQENRTWTVAGGIVQNGGTREQMLVKLEAVRDQVNADTTLGGTVDRAQVAVVAYYSHPDDARVFGEFSVSAEQVA